MNHRILIFFLIVLALITFNCNSQKNIGAKPINNPKLLKSKLNLNDLQINKIIQNDSVMEQVSLALKDSIVHNSVRKTIDSFVLGKYNTKETYVLIKLQLRYKNATIELANKNQRDSLVNMTVEEFEKFHDRLDSLLSKVIEVKSDTIIYKKDQL